MSTIDSKYNILIDGSDFSDIIALDDGYGWEVISLSAESATGQDTLGKFHIPILGERVKLTLRLIEYVPKQRFIQLVSKLKIGSKGQRDVAITYDDPLFGLITRNFYCTNIPWIKEKIPSPPYHYLTGITIQLQSTTYINKAVVNETLGYTPQFNTDPEYEFKINGKEFNDVVNIKGFQGQIIEQSLESLTGQTLDGRFHLPIMGSRTQNEMACVEFLEEKRFRQLGKELGFGLTGERSHTSTYVDPVLGKGTRTFYCTTISGTRYKTPDYPYHYIKGVKFQQAMKNTV